MVVARPPALASDWLRTLVMLAGLAGWSAAVVATIAAGQLPDPLLLGVPGGLYVALHPPAMPWQRAGSSPPAPTSEEPR